MIGQDAVFDRPEQRAQHAVAAERHEQNRHRMQRIAGKRQAGDKNLDEFDDLRHPRLVVAVGDFAAEP